jgi:prepilin-type processing-associated H-X9-DG protein
MVRTLPFVEQENLYRQAGAIDGSANYGIHSKPALYSATFPVLFCPADGAGGQRTATNRAQFAGLSTGLTNYRGVSGSNWCWGNFVHTPANAPGRNGNVDCNGLDNGNGIFFRADIRGRLNLSILTSADGTSNTFMIGEDIPELNLHCHWMYSNGANGTCGIPPNTAVRDPYRNNPATGVTGYSPDSWGNVYSFRSRHSGGLQFCLADGHVVFISDSIDLSTYRALATIAGGEVASLQ